MTDISNSEAGLAEKEATTSNAKCKARKRRGRFPDNEITCLLSKIHKLRRANRRLLRAAVSDDLTCALNRRCLPAILDARLVRARASGSVSLCLFDVDDFKMYNDSRGHHAGDEALRRIAHAVHDNLHRSSDKLFRCGGDEFCVLFTSQSPLHALRLVERLRGAIQEEMRAYSQANGEALTVSFGVVWQCENVVGLLTSGELYTEADRMLYKAKRAGRGEIRLRVIEDAEHPRATLGRLPDHTDSASGPANGMSGPSAKNSPYRFRGRLEDVLARHAAEHSS
jgi:diguanylate cyclase (GGDEF)-like protein